MSNNVSGRSMYFQHWVKVVTICIVVIITCVPGSARSDDTAEASVLGPADLGYSTYLGGSSYETCYDLKQVDGLVIVTGYTQSTNFPVTPGAYDTTINSYSDVFVTKFNSSGSDLIFSTFIGGGGYEMGRGISVDDRGYVYVTGYTDSSDFPTVGGSFDTTYNGNQDAFALVLLPGGSILLYSTYLGGADIDIGNAIEVASGYRAVVVGGTLSSNFPILGGWDNTYNGLGDCFVTALNDSGTSIVKSTFFGGSNSDYAEDLVLSPYDIASITGSTYSSDFPTYSNSFDKTYNGNGDGFLFCMRPIEQDFWGSTYFGGSEYDSGNSIAIGYTPMYVYITGVTSSTNFPTVNAYDGSYNGGDYDAFVGRFFYQGESIFNATYLGGSGSEGGEGISVDVLGNLYVTGDTQSTNFPVTGTAFDMTHNGSNDVFFTLLNIDTSMSLIYSTFLGGSSYEYGKAIDSKDSYEVFITGMTASNNFPVTITGFDTTFNGSEDGFVSKLNIPPPHVDFNLCQGLNLISYPYDDVSITNADALLNSICPGNADSIWKYDCSTKKFTSWTILDPGDGWAVSPGMPVWVNVTNPAGCTWVPPGATPTGISYTTCVGLNLVTVPVYTTSINLASQMLDDIPGCTAIYRYKKEISCLSTAGFEGYFNISPPADDFPVLRGHGYWASTTTAGTWTPPNP